MQRIKRRQQRIWALQALYEADFHGITAVEVLANLEDREPDAEFADYTKRLVSLVMEGLEEIDSKISEFSRDWTIERMAKVDLNILRLAVAEMLYIDDVTDSVAINEAVELAKEFASPKSSKFINGILGALSQALAT